MSEGKSETKKRPGTEEYRPIRYFFRRSLGKVIPKDSTLRGGEIRLRRKRGGPHSEKMNARRGKGGVSTLSLTKTQRSEKEEQIEETLSEEMELTGYGEGGCVNHLPT